MTDDLSWQRVAHTVSAELESGLVIMDVESGRYYSLNETAYAIWNFLEEPRSFREIISKLIAEYDVPADRCRQTVATLLADLEARNLVRRAAGA